MNFEDPTPSPEKVTKAAIRVHGEIFTGKTHGEAMIQMEEKYPDWLESKASVEDGFITSTGRFINREEAGKIALDTGQIEHLEAEEKAESGSNLDSEDILSNQERFEVLRKSFDDAESAFEAQGREKAKAFLRGLYIELAHMNKSTSEGNPLEKWNPAGDLTEAQFNELNLRRKKLSNAIGIITSTGEIRHNLNDI